MIITNNQYKKLFSISIMAHPSRLEFIPYLKEKLGDVPVSIDNGEGIWPNCRNAWTMRDPQSLFHIVLQDDAIIGKNFLENAEKEIYNAQRIGLNAVQFYVGKRTRERTMVRKAIEKGYMTRKNLTWGLAVCLREDLIGPMIEHGNRMTIKQDDARISSFLIHTKNRIYCPLPSLIDHRSGESLVGDPGRFRKAAYFIGE
jgi:hypothetical protein